MNPDLSLNNKQVKRNIIIWIIVIAYLNFDAPVPGSWAAKIIGGLIESLNYVFVFYYLSLFVLPKFWIVRCIFRLITCILVGYSLFVVISYINYLIIIPNIGGHSFHQEEPISYLLLHDVFYFFILSSASAASFYLRYSIYKIKLQSEKEKLLLVKELNFLKNQFNSHITFNFLNYCYSKIHKILSETADLIGFFSDYLRYAVQTKPEEKVPLADEITHIENFIHLQKLLNTNVNATFNVVGETSGKFIFTRILSTIVEDVYEDGICNDPYTPIQVHLKVDNTKLNFTINYKVDQEIKNKDLQADQNFTIQTLNLYYADNYLLNQKMRDSYRMIELFLLLDRNHSNLSESVKIHEDSDKKRNTPKVDEGLLSLMRLSKTQIKRHIIAWVIFILYANLMGSYSGRVEAIIISNALAHCNFIFVFYSMGWYLFPKYWEGKRILLILFILIILMIYWFIAYITFKEIMPALGVFVDLQDYSFYPFLKDRFYYFVIFGSVSVFSFFIRYSLYKLKQHEQQEKMLLGKELYFLKNQFNSPLTFRFLEYCYANIHKHSPATATSIGIFSDMLQYTLQTGPDEKVALSREITYIENFISIEKLLSNKVYTDFSYHGDMEDKKILSRILVTFVENAFKHGLYNDPGFPLRICLEVKKDDMVFRIRNKINPAKRIESTKKGIENVTQILDLYYAGNYELTKAVTDKFYSVELRLNLNE